MRGKQIVQASAVLVLVILAAAALTAATAPVDRTLSNLVPKYVPTAADLAYRGTTAGDVAEADVYVNGTALQYVGVTLNGDGVNPNAPFPFLKVQQQDGTGMFENAACYLGNNGASGTFGLAFFDLTQFFTNAHMRATRNGSTVTISFTKVNGGQLADQTYVCDGAPTPPGDKIGITSLAGATAQLDNYGNGAGVLDTFSYVGPLASSGNWNDAAPGMVADGSRASGGLMALSFWMKTGTPPTLTRIRPRSGAQGKTVNVRMSGTNFVSGSTGVQVSGTGVVVTNVNVVSPTSLTATFTIDPAAATGAREVTVQTPGGTSNAMPFKVRAPLLASCAVSLPLTATRTGGVVNITAGLGTSGQAQGSWAVGSMIFNPGSVTFRGTTVASGALPPAMTYSTTANVGLAPVVGVLNAVYDPYLCGYTIAWPSGTSPMAPYQPVPPAQVEIFLNSLDPEDFDGTIQIIPR